MNVNIADLNNGLRSIVNSAVVINDNWIKFDILGS